MTDRRILDFADHLLISVAPAVLLASIPAAILSAVSKKQFRLISRSIPKTKDEVLQVLLVMGSVAVVALISFFLHGWKMTIVRMIATVMRATALWAWQEHSFSANQLQLFLEKWIPISANDILNAFMIQVLKLTMFQIPIDMFLQGCLPPVASRHLSFFIHWNRAVAFLMSMICLTVMQITTWLNETQRGRQVKREFREALNGAQRTYEKYVSLLNLEVSSPEGRLNIFVNRFIYLERNNVECGSCLEMKSSKRVPKFKSCPHRMCYPCILKYIQESCNEVGGTSLDCPYEPTQCLSLSPEIVHTVLTKMLPPNECMKLNQRLEKAFIKAGLLELQNVMICPSPDCMNAEFSTAELTDQSFLKFKAIRVKARFRETDGRVRERVLAIQKIQHKQKRFSLYKVAKDGVDLRKFKCSGCHYSSCVVCKNLWTYGAVSHSSLTCEEYHEERFADAENAEEILTNNVVQEKKIAGRLRACPKCQALIERSAGCNHMICSRCQTNFCWGCGSHYNSCSCR